MKKWVLLCCLFSSGLSYGQEFLQETPAAKQWADSVKKKLNKRQKIAQLMVIRVSERQGGKDVFFEEQVSKAIRKYNIGALCLFQGGSVEQAEVLNRLQALAKTPLMVTVDGETGVGMRFSDVKPFPNQLTIGATANPQLTYKVGKAIADQCIRAGIQVNYAPVVDINNNPANPVINVRSFGENKELVANLGVQITKGMQDAGIMACAKHFPGHGDVNVDSHYDLPVILKSRKELEQLEIYPFRQLTKAGVGSAMVAHLYIPAIDAEENKATSLSYNNVTNLLRKDVGFNGLTFTDALEMKGVAKFYPQGLAAAKSIIAGNDMLCLPGDIKGSIKQIRRSIRKGELSWKDIDHKVQRVLIAKYNLGIHNLKPVDTTNIVQDLNKDVRSIKEEVYANAITLVKRSDSVSLPLQRGAKVAYVALGVERNNQLASLLSDEYNAEVFTLGHNASTEQASALVKQLDGDYDVIITGLHNFSKNPANDFGIGKPVLDVLAQLQQRDNIINLVFGNPYALKYISNLRNNVIACYEDDAIMHETAVKLLKGEIEAKGVLPVTVNDNFKYGEGLSLVQK
ncbi:hypothetical protein EIM50_17855 [Pseudoxanthomonas sp. SGD-10]|nr:hypothetical protein EIM50_17855 [Pseudoxanthomonas sp. SGD-10]